MSLIKYDSGKRMMALVTVDMVDAMEAVADVLTFGANKYSEQGWFKGIESVEDIPSAIRRYRSAMDRHLAEYAKDVYSVDKESGILHINHALTNLMIIKCLSSDDFIKRNFKQTESTVCICEPCTCGYGTEEQTVVEDNVCPDCSSVLLYDSECRAFICYECGYSCQS